MCRKKAPLERPDFDRWPKIVHKLAQKCQEGHVSKKGTIGKTRFRQMAKNSQQVGPKVSKRPCVEKRHLLKTAPAHFVRDKKLNANVQGGF